MFVGRDPLYKYTGNVPSENEIVELRLDCSGGVDKTQYQTSPMPIR